MKKTPIALAILAAMSHTAHAEDTVKLSDIQVTETVSTPQTEVVKPDALVDTFYTEAGDALRQVNGVEGQRLGGMGIDPMIRGLSQTQLDITIDGAHVVSGCPNRMDPATSYVDITSFSNVKVFKGVETLEYPKAGVHFETVTQPTAQTTGSMYYGLSSQGTGNEMGVDIVTPISFDGGYTYLRTQAYHKTADNYEDGNGDEVKSAYTTRGATFILGNRKANGDEQTLTFAHALHEDVLYDGAKMDSPYSENNRLSAEIKRHNVGPFAKVEATAFYTTVNHLMENRAVPSPTMAVDTDTENTGIKLSGLIEQGTTQYRMGLDLDKQNATTTDMSYALVYDSPGVLNPTKTTNMTNMAQTMWPEGEIIETRAWAERDQLVGDKGNLIAGIQVQQFDASANGTSTNPNITTGKEYTDTEVGGLIRYEHDLGANRTLFTGVSRHSTSADITERFISKTQEGIKDKAHWYGNPELELEKHTQFDLGVEQTGAQNWLINAYYNQIDDFVDATMTGDAVSTSLTSTYHNIDAVIYGLEAKAQRVMKNGVVVKGQIAYMKGEDKTNDVALSQIAPVSGTVTVEHMNHGVRLRFALEQDELGVNDPGYATQTATPAYEVFDFYGTKYFNQTTSLTYGVDNIFDEYYYNHIGRADSFGAGTINVAEPGRTLWLKLNHSF